MALSRTKINISIYFDNRRLYIPWR